MLSESVKISIDGSEVADLYPHIVRLEVEQDDELAAMLRLTIGLGLKPNGSWTLVDDVRLRVWNSVSLQVTMKGRGRKPLFSGYITHLKPSFELGPNDCTLDVWALDGSVLMDRQEKLKDWRNMKDSDIARQIFTQYGYQAQVQDTRVRHDEAVATIIQRETDIQFLRRLALRNGFECYLDGMTGHFHPPKLQQPTQPPVAILFGSESNARRFKIEVNALTPATVTMSQLDRATKEVLSATITTSQQPPLGQTRAGALPRGKVAAGLAVLGGVAATGSPEMAALCQGLYDQGEWFVTGEGELAGNDYGDVLRARETVIIKGVGRNHSGVYYVTHVTHTFSSEGYTQHFRVRRNGYDLTGIELFSPPGSSVSLIG